uniref:Ovule protein n=1 Tax=Ascaris lumbricoides TaxID=6252 RepID=A0A0M3ISE4_ASCLU
MESIKRKQEQMGCSQTWTIAFAVSLMFTIVIGVLLILYCIMYRKHITFLLRGPPNRVSFFFFIYLLIFFFDFIDSE